MVRIVKLQTVRKEGGKEDESDESRGEGVKGRGEERKGRNEV